MTRKVLNPITLATIVVIMYTTLPIMSVFISTYITTYAYMLLIVFLLGFIVLSGGIKRITAIAYTVFPFALYILLTFFTKTDSVLLWGYQSILFLLPVILGYYYIQHKPENMNMFAKIMIFAILITAITTIIGVIQFPQAARILATIAESDSAENIKYGWHNIGGYNFVYICVLMYPMLILAYKFRRINRIVFLITFLALLTLVILSEYTIALLLLLISSALFFAGKRLGEKQLLIFGIIVFAAVFLLWDVFSRFLLWLADVLNSDVLNERLTALANGFTGLENSESNRIELYQISLEGFWASPLFGQIFGQHSDFGGHSFILDSLAQYGILGGMAIVFVYRNIYRWFFKPFKSSPGYGYVLWSFVQAIILSTVNTGMWLEVLAFFIPATLFLIHKPDSEETYEDSMDS
ncbi:MAG: hypothetical protein IKZ59_03155 [Clostridia bacterium]|nr:hypothetical protein [Clostridia bacterium]MBR5922773.1 hypothetical protein [Clostridia bacterium]